MRFLAGIPGTQYLIQAGEGKGDIHLFEAS
jgi:hypothetical protein